MAWGHTAILQFAFCNLTFALKTIEENEMSSSVLEYEAAVSLPLVEEVMKRSGQNLVACYQCRRCAAGCPVGEEAGVTPDQLIRMVLLGDREAAVNNLLVWKCVACYTCGTRCPNNIQTARITETLKQMGKKAHAAPLLPRVADFHSSFMTATGHFGRFNEIKRRGWETRYGNSLLSRLFIACFVATVRHPVQARVQEPGHGAQGDRGLELLRRYSGEQDR